MTRSAAEDSDYPDDSALWTIRAFVEEVAGMRDTVGWTAWTCSVPPGAVRFSRRPGPAEPAPSLVLASTCASLPGFAPETRRLKASFPAEVQDEINRHEAEGTTGDDAYEEATMACSRGQYCRLDLPWPDHLMRSFNNLNEEIYGTMQGPEWNVTGNLRDWDISARLGELDLPVLVTSGGHDEMTPALVQPLVDGIRGADSVVFEQSAHFAMAEEPDRYLEALDSFLGRVEARTSRSN